MRRYNIIYADPPWPHRSGSQEKVVPYSTMSIREICNLPIKSIIRRDTVLFLWTTDKYLPAALEVMSSWGFSYKTIAFNWVKKTKNNKLSLMVGGWTVKCTEICLLGTRGKPHKFLKCRKGIYQLVDASVRGHSVKPKEVRKCIEKMFDSKIRKIELFAREEHKGWDVWGNEVKSDIRIKI